MPGRSEQIAPAVKVEGAADSNERHEPGISASLLGLPAHIRARIFELVLVVPCYGNWNPGIPVEAPSFGLYEHRFGEPIGLLRVCKSIHEEASTISYGQNEFEYLQRSMSGDDEFETRYLYQSSKLDSYPIMDWLEGIGDRNRERVKRINIQDFGRHYHGCHGTGSAHVMDFGHELSALCLAPNCTLRFLPSPPPYSGSKGRNPVYTCHSTPNYELIATTLHALREYAIIRIWMDFNLLREVRIPLEDLVGELRFQNHKGVEWGLEFRVRDSRRKPIFRIKKEPLDDDAMTAIKIESDEEDGGKETVVDFVTKRKRLYDIASLVMPYLLGPSILQVDVLDPMLPENVESESEGSEIEESETEYSDISESEIEDLEKDTIESGQPDGRQDSHDPVPVSYYAKASDYSKSPNGPEASNYPEVFPLLPIGLSATSKLFDIALRFVYPQTAFAFYFKMYDNDAPSLEDIVQALHKSC